MVVSMTKQKLRAGLTHDDRTYLFDTDNYVVKKFHGATVVTCTLLQSMMVQHGTT